MSSPPPSLHATLLSVLEAHSVAGVTVAVLTGDAGPGSAVESCAAGVADHLSKSAMAPETWVEHCSLSKTVGSAFALSYLAERGVAIDASVNGLLERVKSPFRLMSAAGKPAAWAGQVQVRHLMDHTGLGMHYVYGIPPSYAGGMPPVLDILEGKHGPGRGACSGMEVGYDRVEVHKEPGTQFGYSGGGFLVLQHILECWEGGRPIAEIMAPFMLQCGMSAPEDRASPEFSFVQDHRDIPFPFAAGYMDSGAQVTDGRLMFPPLAAGGVGTARSLASFLWHLAVAYKSSAGSGPISQEVAVAMLDGVCGDRQGSMDFMGAVMGVGVFIADAGPNRIMIHQAANDGFRGVYMVCFDGPSAQDGPKGFVILANGDNKAVGINCDLSRDLLQRLAITGIDWSRVDGRTFSLEGLKQEEIVNLGLKELVLDAFEEPSGAARARL